MRQKEMSLEEREARRWQITKQLRSDGEITAEQLRELGLIDWMEEDNFIARMRLIFFWCTAIACTAWMVSGLIAYFVVGNIGMFLASPLIAFPVYKTVEYFVKRSRQARR